MGLIKIHCVRSKQRWSAKAGSVPAFPLPACMDLLLPHRNPRVASGHQTRRPLASSPTKNPRLPPGTAPSYSLSCGYGLKVYCVSKAPAAHPTPPGCDRGALQGGKRHPEVTRRCHGSNADTHVAENPTLQPQWQLGAGMSKRDVVRGAPGLNYETETSHGCQEAEPLPCGCLGPGDLQGWWDPLRTSYQKSEHLTHQRADPSGSHRRQELRLFPPGTQHSTSPSEHVFCPPVSPKDNVRQQVQYSHVTNLQHPNFLLNALKTQCDH